MSKKRNRGSTPVARQEHHVQIAAATRTTTIHTGPLPDPETFERYEAVCAGAAERILTMAEEQSKHRREIERTVIKSNVLNSKLGIFFGFLIAVMTTCSGAYVIVNGFPWPGTFLGGSGLAGLVGVFVYGTRESRQERERKAGLY